MLVRSRTLILVLAALLPALDALASRRVGDLELEPYTLVAFDGRAVDGELGRLVVPETRAAPSAATLRIAFVRLPATTPTPGPPIVYLAGGPGGSGIETARGHRFDVFMAMRAFGDVILLDQRGTGLAEPNLTCEERVTLPIDRAETKASVLDAYQEASASCAARFRREGLDLTAYNTNESADDVDDVRKALGANAMVLWGTSYGTHLALATLRRHGSFVDKAILHGVEGPDHTLKLPQQVQTVLEQLDGLVAADSSGRFLTPDFLGSLRRWVAELSQTPRTVALTDEESGTSFDVTFGGFDLVRRLAASMGDSEFYTVFPLVLSQMDAGFFDVIAAAIAEDRSLPLGSAMSFAMDCASNVSSARREEIARQHSSAILGDAINFPLPELCPTWGVRALEGDFRSPLTSSVRTLFISGTLDARTPPTNAREVVRGFPAGEELLIAGAAHNDLFVSHPDILAVMEDFMAGRPLRTHTIALPPIVFRSSFP